MIPEFVGRLPGRRHARAARRRRRSINILTEPKNALVKQYQKFFRMESSELEFTPGALRLIAKRALKRDTGARALRAVCEEIMLDLMYSLPDEGAGRQIRHQRRRRRRPKKPLRNQARNPQKRIRLDELQNRIIQEPSPNAGLLCRSNERRCRMGKTIEPTKPPSKPSADDQIIVVHGDPNITEEQRQKNQAAIEWFRQEA